MQKKRASVFSQFVEVDRDLYDEYADLRQYLREQPIIVSDEIKKAIPDYGDFRKSRRGGTPGRNFFLLTNRGEMRIIITLS